MTLFCSLFGAALVANTLAADDESDAIYGKGVHAFFDGNYEGTITVLSQAEKIKSVDPRPFYFLGLAYLRQEKFEQADRWFEKAAQLEYSGRAARDYAVSESLRRIQGAERMRIESIRTEEQTNARIRELQLQEARYGKENAANRAETVRQLTPPDQQKMDRVLLQNMVVNISENAFGVRAMNPISTTEDNVIVRRVDTTFGDVVVSEVPEILETFSGGGGGAVGLVIKMIPAEDKRAAAKESGKALGSLFSIKAKGE